MTKTSTILAAGLGLFMFGVSLLGCNKGKESENPETAAPASGAETPPPADAPSDRPSLTDAECQAKGGTVIGDIGDGAIHKPDYVCANGKPPLGSIRVEGDAPVAIEGSVCCPADA